MIKGYFNAKISKRRVGNIIGDWDGEREMKGLSDKYNLRDSTHGKH